MTSAVQAILDAATDLSPSEQLEVVEGIVGALHDQFAQPLAMNGIVPKGEPGLPSSVKRTAPVTDLAHLAAAFWPEDETADEINAYIAKQRAEDLMLDR